jgi:hypothetical protein
MKPDRRRADLAVIGRAARSGWLFIIAGVFKLGELSSTAPTKDDMADR